MIDRVFFRELTYRTLPDALFAAPEEKPFVTSWKNKDDIESVTFGEFKRRTLSQARYFRSKGVKPGDTIILIMPQSIALMAAFVGVMLIGAVPAILAYPNFKVEPTKYRYGLKGVSANLKATLILVDKDFPDELMEHVSVDGAARLVPCAEEPLLEPVTAEVHIGLPNDLAFIQHSAGTTGLQKGVALSHAAVLKQISHLIPMIDIGREDRIYSWLPLYHDMGLIRALCCPLCVICRWSCNRPPI